jgi:glycosyltransferase involved in cell wall biosynthesis
MARILVFTTDLPYFPGKMGVDFFNLRFLATRHEVAVVGPLYEFAPAEGVRNLEEAVTRVHAWPRPIATVPLFVQGDAPGVLPGWVERLPARLRRGVMKRLLGIHRAPADAFERLAIQSNCAPYLLKAMEEAACKAIILIQSNLAPCLEFLPGPGVRFFYFHDVRADYFARLQASGGVRPTSREILAVTRQERAICHVADAVGFVSDLDRTRAQHLFQPTCLTGVAPIPVDTDYFKPAPPDWPGRTEPTVLFTGHLSHPPNIDAIKYFLAEIWPLILRALPAARFVAAGMLPADELKDLVTTVPNFELHANVPDIRPFFWDARVYVVPMRFGGGVRQKIFEAWSMQVPVVCTTMAAEGIAARQGENCWLEDTPVAFAARVVELAQAKASGGNTVAAAKLQVEANNSIPAAAARFTALVEKSISFRKHRPFRLLYDLRWMQIGVAGGAEQMTHELLHALSQLDRRNSYRLFCPRNTFHEWDFPPEFHARGIFCDLLEKTGESLHAAAVNRLAEGLGLPPILTAPMRTLRALHRMDFDLVHSLIGYVHPDLAAFPSILTTHDLQHIRYPEFFTPTEWQERDRLYRESAGRARHIICISEHTRQDMHRHLGVPLEKMTTVWNIPSRQVWQVLPASLREKLLASLGVESPFLFFPGHCWLHKNHANLVEAFALIRPQLPPGMKLIFTGRPFSPDHPALRSIQQLGLSTHILHLGYRSALEIQALFQGCFMLVFPSLFEGFGMPVAEAIITGKPVACSNRTSLPEIAGDAAITFDPDDVHDIGARLLDVITDPQRYMTLVEATKRRRILFSSRMSAIKTLAVYQRVYEELYT